MIYPHPLIALDTETGGTLPSKHALLSISARLWLPDKPSYGRFDSYIQPAEGKIIDPEAAAKNGYTPDLWEELGVQPLTIVLQHFQSFLNNCFKAHPTARLLAHNVGFDRAFLEEAAAMTGITLPIRHAWRCSMQLFGHLTDKGILPEGSLKLERLAQLAGLRPQAQIHTATDDADLCYHGYQWLLKTEHEHYLQTFSKP